MTLREATASAKQTCRSSASGSSVVVVTRASIAISWYTNDWCTLEFVRPTMFQWLKYAATGSAPGHLSEWVLHDVTARTWLLRHTARFFLYLTPFIVAVLVFLPAPWPLRLGCVLIGVLGSVALSFGYT